MGAPKSWSSHETQQTPSVTMSPSFVDETYSVAATTHARIGPPTTINDDGSPTESISMDAERIFRLIEDERHLVAQTLYHNVQSRLNNQAASQSPTNTKGSGKPKKLHLLSLHSRRQHQETEKLKSSERKEHEKARQVLEANVAILKKLEVILRFLMEDDDEMKNRVLLASRGSASLTVDFFL